MQPAASATDGVAVKRIRGEVSGGTLPNEEKFWKKKVEDIPVDEVGSCLLDIQRRLIPPRSSSTNISREKTVGNLLKVASTRVAKGRDRKQQHPRRTVSAANTKSMKKHPVSQKRMLCGRCGR